jgi:hypothetical protein
MPKEGLWSDEEATPLGDEIGPSQSTDLIPASLSSRISAPGSAATIGECVARATCAPSEARRSSTKVSCSRASKANRRKSDRLADDRTSEVHDKAAEACDDRSGSERPSNK